MVNGFCLWRIAGERAEDMTECDGIARLLRAFFIAVIALCVALVVAIFWLGRASAADHPTPQERVACGADVYRFCSGAKDKGGVVYCLKEHRAVLSKTCSTLLVERGL